MAIKVMVRKGRGEDGCFALFPEDPATDDGWLCTVYDPTCGHSGADIPLCVADSKPATEAETADMLKELERVGYTGLVAVKRCHRKAYAVRQAAAKIQVKSV